MPNQPPPQSSTGGWQELENTQRRRSLLARRTLPDLPCLSPLREAKRQTRQRKLGWVWSFGVDYPPHDANPAAPMDQGGNANRNDDR